MKNSKNIVSEVTDKQIAGKDYQSVSITTGRGDVYRFDLHSSGFIYIYYPGATPGSAFGSFNLAKKDAEKAGSFEFLQLLELAEAALLGHVEPIERDDAEAIREGMIAGRKLIDAEVERIDQPAANKHIEAAVKELDHACVGASDAEAIVAVYREIKKSSGKYYNEEKFNNAIGKMHDACDRIGANYSYTIEILGRHFVEVAKKLDANPSDADLQAAFRFLAGREFGQDPTPAAVAAEEPVAHGYVNPDPDQLIYASRKEIINQFGKRNGKALELDIQQAWRDWCTMNAADWQANYPDGDYWHYAYQQNPEVDGIWIDEAPDLNERMLKDAIGLNFHNWDSKHGFADYFQYRKIAIDHGLGLQAGSFPALADEYPGGIIKAVAEIWFPDWQMNLINPALMDSPASFVNFLEVANKLKVEAIRITIEMPSGLIINRNIKLSELLGQGDGDQPDPDQPRKPKISDILKDDKADIDEQVAKYGPESEKLHDSFMLDTDEYIAKHYPDQPEFSIELAKDYDIEPNRYKVKKHFFGLYREPEHLAADIESFFEKYGPAVLPMIMIKEVISNNVDFISLTYFKRLYLSNAKQDDQPRPSFPAGGIISKAEGAINEEPTLPAAGIPVDEFKALAAKFPGGRILQHAAGKDKGIVTRSRRQFLGFISFCKESGIKQVKLKIWLAEGGCKIWRSPIQEFNISGPQRLNW